jgi:hypothetical protein
MSQVQVAAQPRSMITELKAGERNPEIWAKWSALKVIFHLFDEKKGWVRCESPASALWESPRLNKVEVSVSSEEDPPASEYRSRLEHSKEFPGNQYVLPQLLTGEWLFAVHVSYDLCLLSSGERKTSASWKQKPSRRMPSKPNQVFRVRYSGTDLEFWNCMPNR